MQPSSSYDLTILHTNDIHDRVEQFSGSGNTCRQKHLLENQCFGGVSRRYSKLKEIRTTDANTIFLDAGDQFMGTLWFTKYGGEKTAYFMNKMHYTAMSFGNHEFDRGVDGLVPFLSQLNFPVICSNINFDQEPRLQGLIKKSEVFNVGGQRIGVVGYVTPKTKDISNTGPFITLEDEISALQREVDNLVADGVNKIIAIGHSGYTVDRDIAARVTGVDVVIGGHTNTFLYTGTPPSSEDPVGAYPEVVTQQNSGNPVLVVQDYTFGKYLGYLKTTWNDAGVITHYEGNPILLDASVPQDEEVEAKVQEFAGPVRELANEHIGTTRVKLEGNRMICRLEECNMGNFLADSMARKYYRNYTDDRWAEVGLALINGGSIRASIDPGDITRADVSNVQPFKNTIVMLEIKGRYIWDAFELAVAETNTVDPEGRFLHVSGFRVEYNYMYPNHQRVVSIEVLCVDCSVPVYEPLENERVYKFMTYSFLANGGDRFTMFKDNHISMSNFGDDDVTATVEYLKSLSPVMFAEEGRIKVMGLEELKSQQAIH